MNYQHLEYAITQNIAILTIDRPPVNALNRELISELDQVVDAIAKDIKANKVRVAILTGKGKHFSAGADLKERIEMAEAEVASTVQSIGQVFRKIAALAVPTIA